MKLSLPPRVSARNFERALQRFAAVVGEQWVLATDEDRDTYLDAYALDSGESYGPSAALAPQSVAEIQALLRIANELKIPLWPNSRGKNLGYGGSAPRMRGTVILDLTRMKRILEVNEKFGYCLLEPGVGFFDLYDHLRQNKIPLWMGVPGNAWGSVVGNALEHGFSYTPYGEHASKVCGMEVVLASGEVVRTGMGAMAKSSAWQLFPYGYGPAWDRVFMQSNFGIVTKMGLWLYPEPESTLLIDVQLPHDDDLGWAIDTLAPLRMRGVIQHPANIGNAIRAATTRSQRDEWYRGQGAMPNATIDEMIAKLGLGRWNSALRFFGDDAVNEANARIVKEALAKHTSLEFKTSKWHRGEPLEASGAGVPSLLPLQVVNWRGGRGGHLGFSPISPPASEHALQQYRMVRARFEEFGFDYFGSFTLGERYLVHVTMIIYDRDDPTMTANARALFKAVMNDAAREGYGEYRAHLEFMDDVAHCYDFNDHALFKLNQTFKDAIDPNGILAPGKQGIWPRALRAGKEQS